MTNKKPQKLERRKQVRIASGLSGVVSSEGLVLSTIMRNRFNSSDVGIVIALGDNPDEVFYIGQVR